MNVFCSKNINITKFKPNKDPTDFKNYEKQLNNEMQFSIQATWLS